MDIFRFLNPTAPLQMEHGEIINGLTSKMWVERYAEAGEFTLVAPVSSDIRTKLPIGSFISHMDTDELMVVDNHEINDETDGESTITVTGRGFETILEQRIVGCNRNFPIERPEDLRLLVPSGRTWAQIQYLIERHILPVYMIDPNNALGFISVQNAVTGVGVEPDISRRIDTNDVYSEIVKLMEIDNVGVKCVRPGIWSTLGVSSPNVAIRIHKGTDRTTTVVFSYETGKVVSANYLWSNKNLKNSALCTGSFIQTIVNLGPTNYNRRMMAVDTSDIDDYFNPDFLPVDDFLTVYANLMKQRGREALMKQKNIALVKAEVSKDSVDTEYRVHYNVGDLITMVGGYSETATMRVSEFVEIEDENGTVAYPTLSLE